MGTGQKPTMMSLPILESGMSESNNNKSTPNQYFEKLYVLENNEAFLVGNQCESCGQISIAVGTKCVDCGNVSLKKIKFGKKGVLYSFVVSQMPSSNFNPPYTAGWIDVAEGIRIFAPLRMNNGDKYTIGMPVVLNIGELWKEKGKAVSGPYYTPFGSTLIT